MQDDIPEGHPDLAGHVSEARDGGSAGQVLVQRAPTSKGIGRRLHPVCPERGGEIETSWSATNGRDIDYRHMQGAFGSAPEGGRRASQWQR